MKQFIFLFLFLFFATITFAHTDNVPHMLSQWLQRGGSSDYNTDGRVNSLDYIINIHPGQIHPTPTTGPTPTPDTSWPAIQLQSFVTGLDQPIHLTHSGDNTNRLFVVEQTGRVRLIKNGTLQSTPFLNITPRVGCCGERGLLGLAFPPNFSSKQYFYVNYTNTSGHTVIARYSVGQNPDQALSDSEQIILTINQPFDNHNGGSLAFGLDGFLYIPTGDGGSAGDPGNRAQNPSDLLGKILRIDVESGVTPYSIPTSNPFFTTSGYRPEIWALGLRNPWKFSFDRQTGDLYLADVGQNQWEEVNFQSAGIGGQNYGWRCREGNHDFNFSGNCGSLNLINPVAEYNHSTGGCSVTGGYVYRGPSTPLQGIYFYADYCSGVIWGLRKNGSQWQTSQLLDTSLTISSFGQDQSGNLYVVDHSGSIHKINFIP